MKKILKKMFALSLVMLVMIGVVACGKNNDKSCDAKEKVELAKTTLGEIEFENGEGVKLSQDCDVVTISGSIDEMSDSQKMEFGQEGVSHVVVLKFKFDDERTIDKFEIKGGVTKVYSTNDKDENYVGSISELLDSGSGEDAYTYLILSASTKEYKLTSTYSDKSSSVITVKMNASLAEINE